MLQFDFKSLKHDSDFKRPYVVTPERVVKIQAENRRRIKDMAMSGRIEDKVREVCKGRD